MRGVIHQARDLGPCEHRGNNGVGCACPITYCGDRMENALECVTYRQVS